MPLFSSRRKPRLAPALDDVELGRLTRALADGSRADMMGVADLHIARIEEALQRTATDWDRRAHRLSVLAAATAGTGIPRMWASRDPNCADALLLHAWARLVQGRRSGRPIDADSVVQACYRASDLVPEDPTPWVITLGVSRLERYERASVLAVWREVVARDRWHREAHLQMLGYLSPEEGGSRMQVLDFVDAVRDRTPADAPTAAVELTAAVQQYRSVAARSGVEALMSRDFWAHGPVARALERADRSWPEPGFLKHAAALADLNLLAYALVSAERRRSAARVFTVLEGRATSWPWETDGDPLDTFTREQARSVR